MCEKVTSKKVMSGSYIAIIPFLCLCSNLWRLTSSPAAPTSQEMCNGWFTALGLDVLSPLLTVVSFGWRGVVEFLQGVAAAFLQDVVEVQDEHHDHAFLVLHGDDMCGAQEVRT